MSKAFIAAVLQDSMGSTAVAAIKAAEDLIEAIVSEIEKTGGFTLPSFGTFTAKDTSARKALNPRTGEEVWVEAGRTVRFKASPNLKERLTPVKAKAKAKVSKAASTKTADTTPKKAASAKPRATKAAETTKAIPVKATRGRPKKAG